jgi:hypothetical protein
MTAEALSSWQLSLRLHVSQQLQSSYREAAASLLLLLLLLLLL